ncbi:MAG TPA: Glu/Leu/Phe/Val dehydrogenase dimerization domain-containing protein [Kofleriaceae bacterium]|nr:Glu/Leu/Phe/Val dehydrogenase dimerization domain-containing protein [Kofleriaceae bacterium]
MGERAEDSSLFELVAALGCARVTLWSDPPSGLRAVLVVDDMTLGPAVGGIRTRAYPSLAAAIADAAALARAMVIKTALGGVDAGGCKIVVLDHPGLDRPAGFARLGQLVAELGGLVRTAGDLGTTIDDLAAAARHCAFVNTEHDDLTGATARTLVRCVEACAEVAGGGGVAGLRVAVQGCGAIGAAAARALAAAGARLVVADVDAARAEAIARETGGRVVAADAILFEDVDLVCPCAIGGVITTGAADRVRAWAVCGAANNVIAEPAAEARLAARGILFVPDVMASSGAVIRGVSQGVMGLADATPLIDAVGTTAREILAASRASGRLASDLARERAFARIERVRSSRGAAAGASPG